jgi:CubicO group peptidase (beta-lactamase class C family)
LILAEENKLQLDDPLSQYLPELMRLGTKVTLRRLLNQTAGIPDYYIDRTLLTTLLGRAALPTNQDGLALLSTTGEPRSKPGDEFAYGDMGYELLAIVIERVAQRPDGTFIQDRILAPVGMTHTFSLPNPARRHDPQIPHSYVQDNGMNWAV